MLNWLGRATHCGRIFWLGTSVKRPSEAEMATSALIQLPATAPQVIKLDSPHSGLH